MTASMPTTRRPSGGSSFPVVSADAATLSWGAKLRYGVTGRDRTTPSSCTDRGGVRRGNNHQPPSRRRAWPTHEKTLPLRSVCDARGSQLQNSPDNRTCQVRSKGAIAAVMSGRNPVEAAFTRRRRVNISGIRAFLGGLVHRCPVRRHVCGGHLGTMRLDVGEQTVHLEKNT